MKNRYATASAFVFATCSFAVLLAPACGGSSGSPGFGGLGSSSGAGGGSGGGSGGGGGSGSGSGGTIGLGSGSGSGGGSGGGTSDGGGIACPSGMQCNVSCSGGGTTTITGTIMDPAGSDPLYNVIAYVPSSPLGKLPSGVLTGADKCSCSALLQGNPLVYGSSDTNGKFTITNAPVGTNIPLVIQVGKWRKQLTVTTTSCGSVDAGKINLPKNGTEGDIPDIAVSTGGADSLECLMRRIGLDASEYVPGWTQPGHVHIFNGTKGEANPMTSAPDSTASLWDSAADLMKNDIVLLSCEGQEPSGAIPQNLEDYLNAGGRAFASHFHYAWFSGTLQGGGGGGYTAPADWGTNLAQWTGGGGGGGGGSATVGGNIVTTLTAGGSFPKGVALGQWLANVNALGGGVPAGELPVAAPRYNAKVTTEKPSQSWIQLDPSTDSTGANAPTLYFSFDTPVNPPVSSDGSPQYCGRAVFSGLHVGGASFDGVNCNAGGGGKGGNAGGCNTGHVAAAPPPAGCDTTHPLSPQEKALEFMLFDLSACVIPENVPPTSDAGVYIPK